MSYHEAESPSWMAAQWRANVALNDAKEGQREFSDATVNSVKAHEKLEETMKTSVFSFMGL